MTSTIVRQGHRLHLKGILSRGDSVTAEGGTKKYAGGQILVEGNVINEGLITLDSGSGLASPGGTLTDSGVLINMYSIVVGTGLRGGAASLHVTPLGLLTNSGRIGVAGGMTGTDGMVGLGGQLLDSGTLANGGVITLGGGGADTIGTDAATGATLTDSGTLSNTGTITVAAGASISYQGAAGLGALLDVTGVLTNFGAIAVADFIGTKNAYAAGTTATLLVEGVLTNDVIITVGAHIGTSLSNRYSYYGRGGLLSVTGTLDNPGTIGVGGGIHDLYNGGAGATLDNSGLLTNSGYISLAVGEAAGTYSHAGLGAVLLDSGSMLNAGEIVVGTRLAQYLGGGAANLAITPTGTLTNTGTVTLDNGYQPGAPGSSLTNQGVLTNGGTIVIHGGDGGNYYPSPPNQNAILVNAGQLTNSGLIQVDGGTYRDPYVRIDGAGGTLLNTGTLTNTGTLIAGPDASEHSYGTGGMIANSGVLANSGLIMLEVGYSYRYTGHDYATLVDSGVLTNAGRIEVDRHSAGYYSQGNPLETALLTITSTGILANTGTIFGAGVLANAGLITDGGGTTGDIAIASLVNDASISVGFREAMRIDSAITADAHQHGTLSIAAAGSLTLNGAVDASQTVAFGGHGALLTLGDAVNDHATIDGFVSKDTIDLVGLLAISATSTGTVLNIGLSTGTTLSFQLGAPLNQHLALTTMSDGHGGTDITLLDAAASHPSLGHQDFASFADLSPSTGKPETESGFATLHSSPDFGLNFLAWGHPR